MAFGHVNESLVMSFEIADEWAVGFDDDFVLVAIVDYCSLLIPWMKLCGDMEVSASIATIEVQLGNV